MIASTPFSYTTRGSEPYLQHTEFDASPVHRNRLACIVKMIADKGPGQRVLEIGCGVGNIARPLAGLGYRVTGIEPHGPSLEEARRRNTSANLELRQQAVEDVDISEFDTLVLTEVLEHVPRCGDLLQTISRGMKPGVRLVVTTPNGRSLCERLLRPSYRLKQTRIGASLVRGIKKMLGAHDLTTANLQTPHVHFFTLPALDSLFEESALHPIRFHRYFRNWLIRETFLTGRARDEERARRDFERSQQLPAESCALWAFLLERH
jgi:SAM-dependent methyltransferase